jgi:hypothetical protein
MDATVRDDVYQVYQALNALSRLARPDVDAAELEPQVGALCSILAEKLFGAYAQLVDAALAGCTCGQHHEEKDDVHGR